MRHGRFITTALVATAAMAVGPAWASAATFTDDAPADFSAGTPGTATSVTDAPGSVRLAKTLKSEPFNGPALPSSLAATQWTAGAGTTAFDAGSLKVDGERVNDTRMYDAGQTLEFTATFPTTTYESIGFGNTLEDGPWAIFSSGSTGGGADLEVSTRAAAGQAPVTTNIAGLTLNTPHTFRIVWTATSIEYYVLDFKSTPVATDSVAIAGQMRPVISDATAGDGGVLSVDSLGLNLFADSGAFQSRVQNAGDARAVWGQLNATLVGSGATFETRSGKTPTPDASWSAYQPLGAGGAIQSPSGQYIQYRATLSTADDRVTPSLDRVDMSYAIDAVAPSVAADSVSVSGTSARAAFSSPDSDIAGFQCSLDGGVFTACTSPKEFTGLSAGSHTVSVRGVDKVGNIGAPAAKTFSIASSGGGGQSGGNSAVDKTAPKVTLAAKSLKASKKGTVSFTVGCPATETSCKITLKLKNGKKTVASKTVTVKGGKTKTVTLQLNKATRQQLKHRSLKVSSVVSATDAAGNKKTTSKKVTLRKV